MSFLVLESLVKLMSNTNADSNVFQFSCARKVLRTQILQMLDHRHCKGFLNLVGKTLDSLTYANHILLLKHVSSPAIEKPFCMIINNYWMRLSMIARIIKAEVCVICRSRRLRRITQTEALIILAIMRKPNPIIVLLCIYLGKCSMCSLNKKYHPFFELLHKTAALAYLQAFLSFEVHLLSFLSNIDEKLSVYIFIIKKEVQVFC